jgi:hypothetical protein
MAGKLGEDASRRENRKRLKSVILVGLGINPASFVLGRLSTKLTVPA